MNVRRKIGKERNISGFNISEVKDDPPFATAGCSSFGVPSELDELLVRPLQEMRYK